MPSLIRETKHLLGLTLPILVTQFAQTGMGLIDTIMAGSLSANDLAGVSVGAGLFLPIMLFFTGILFATTPINASFWGQGRTKTLIANTHSAAILSLGLGILGFTCTHLLPFALPLFGVTGSVSTIAQDYLKYIALGVPALCLYTVLRCYCESLGRPMGVTIISLLLLPIVAALNHLFMYGFELFGFLISPMGGAGTGLATALTYWIGLGLLLGLVLMHGAFAQARLLQRIRFNRILAMRLLKLGLPIGLALLCEVSMFSLAALVVGPLGAITIAGHQVALSIASVLFMVPMSLALALTIAIGGAFGQGDMARLIRLQKLGFVIGTLLSLATMGILILGKESIIRLYTTDPDVIAVALPLALAASAYQVVDAWQVCAAGALRGMQDTKSPMLAVFFAYWVVALPLGFYWTRYTSLGALGMWLAFILGLSIAGGILCKKLLSINALLKIRFDDAPKI